MDSKAIGQFVPLILIFVIFYFLLIRPQQRKVKEHKAMVDSVARGDMVVASGGLMGKIVRVLEDDKVELEISDNVIVKVIRSSISAVVSKTEPK
ncbi:MAG: preprotein translocase subunit YajC [Pelagibacteraceae bacterium]|jgi:preprotein translocase subunit YajC|uniref:preprotein translocase subunit YajC n=1 Tax=Pelagibacter sp. (strain IMCC9063) TaxID=1002672 RepID=UPI0002046854|nr:preprotein translocase subunit YajC [Candidatus Pelagibacter sp. IMCC9063]AEA81604.1 preprotein translocase subunit YajC [Candidatus Pelagibacter sp. IMCC9063]MDB0036483.1 preprotein translocase subunit YajC [Pelagibacteraceae bacterium]|tara:strand:- start:283 stop:564 length:282 start_codon:yes stop_codon:yes gene_type:complete